MLRRTNNASYCRQPIGSNGNVPEKRRRRDYKFSTCRARIITAGEAAMDQFELQVAPWACLLSRLALYECHGARDRDLSGASRIGAANHRDAVIGTGAT